MVCLWIKLPKSTLCKLAFWYNAKAALHHVCEILHAQFGWRANMNIKSSVLAGFRSGLWLNRFKRLISYDLKPLRCSSGCMLRVFVLLENESYVYRGSHYNRGNWISTFHIFMCEMCNWLFFFPLHNYYEPTQYFVLIYLIEYLGICGYNVIKHESSRKTSACKKAKKRKRHWEEFCWLVRDLFVSTPTIANLEF